MPDKAKRQGRKRGQTKDRVLQARIPEQLDDEIRGRAEQLGLSVSTIVRNVLLNTFDLVEGVVSDSSQIARALSGAKESQPTAKKELPSPLPVETDSPDSVIGWQQVILNKNGVCEQCNAILKIGETAALGVPTGPRALLLCSDCLTERTASAIAPDKASKPASRKKATASAQVGKAKR
ncbi:Uncharacterised protein [Halioglobus japonicus]|nr:Uncharacterised protein [Halioglobus japonicus]